MPPAFKRTRYYEQESFDGQALTLSDLFGSNGPRLHPPAVPVISSPTYAVNKTNVAKTSRGLFRVEHREQVEPSLSIALPHEGQEERVLLFQVGRQGAIGKIIFSSTLPTEAERSCDQLSERWQHGDDNDTETRRKSAVDARIHVLHVAQGMWIFSNADGSALKRDEPI